MSRFLLLLGVVLINNASAASLSEPVTFWGMCDASAAVALNDDAFAVANDEDNLLRIYRLSQPGPPASTHSLNPLLTGKRKAPETDLEGMARLGDRIFCISSHGRNATGKAAPYRHRLFAFEIRQTNSTIAIVPSGKPYTNLVQDLIREPRLAEFRLEESAKLAPKTPGGLNIEALTDLTDGRLLIGFRNPVPNGKALAIPLLNPVAVVSGSQPKFGDPLLLDLGGLGFRGIGSAGRSHYIMAGPIDRQEDCRLFVWDGIAAKPSPVEGIALSGLSLEGICFHDSGTRPDFLMLSDDGALQVRGEDCKSLPEAERRFRAFRIALD